MMTINSVRIKSTAFTLLELMIVISIMLILAAIVIGGAGYAQRAAAENRARAEVRALELALQSYKLDNGAYPNPANGVPNGVKNTNKSQYSAPSTFLYTALVKGTKVYFKDVPRAMLDNPSNPTSFQDPWGNGYGWSASTDPTENPNHPEVSVWSLGSEPTNKAKWITNF